MTEFTTWRSLVDGAEISGILDNGLLHDFEAATLDLSEGDTVTGDWGNQKGTEDLSPVGSPTYREDAIGGEAGVELDGSNDGFDSSITEPQPLVWFIVYDTTDTNATERVISEGDGESAHIIQDRSDNNEYAFNWGDFQNGGTFQSGEAILAVVADGGGSVFRRNGSEEFSADGGTNGIANMSLGYHPETDSEYNDMTISRLLCYDESEMEDGQISDVENALNDIYGVY